MTAAALLLALLAAAPARAARYDPDFDRASLRQAAAGSRASAVDAAGVALEPDNAALIAARLDESLRLAKLASAAAAALDAGARRRDAEMEAGAKAASDDKLKELSAPLEEQRLAWRRLTGEAAELATKVEALPDEERKKLKPLLAKAADALRSADEALGAPEAAVREAARLGGELREARREALGPFVETSSSSAGVMIRADELAVPVAEAKARLAALGQEPRSAARSRAWEKLELARDTALALFQHADAACNRADDFRRRSAAYERSSEAHGRARAAAGAGPAAARAALDEARGLLARVRERLQRP